MAVLPVAVKQILKLGSRGADIAVIEGAMGFYDGLEGGSRCSAWSLSRSTGTPVILVVDASGSAASAAATALGFLRYRTDSGIAGVFVQRASSERHYLQVADAMAGIGLPCVGWLPKDDRLMLPSRHLGLVPAAEQTELRAKIDLAAGLVRLDVDALKKAAQVPPVDVPDPVFPKILAGKRIALADDEAFSFIYGANCAALEGMGAELVRFSPLRDARLPEGIDALWLPGGFPEVFEGPLKADREMCASVRAAVDGGLRVYAECGGMLYLAMIGAIPLRWRMTDRLQRFGYISVTDADGAAFPAHEFHHSIVEPTAPLATRFTVMKRGEAYREGYVYRNVLAGYPHLHFFERPELAGRLFAGT